jgi:MFS family permease
MSSTGVITVPGFLARERTIAGPGFSRWLIPPAALAIHLCIGMAYGFSVFWLPLSKALGITSPVACPAGMGLFGRMVSSSCDWKISDLQGTFILFFVFLGSAAFAYGGWLERAGPRKAGVVAALCWCGGLVVSAFAISIHQLWLLWLGSGVIGGIGLGLGYISPVSTLIKWFPDRRGMATGMAIMGFGGGAMIGAPLADKLMKHYATATSVGVWETFVTLAAIYFVFMLAGALGYRLPAEGWRPRGWDPARETHKALVTDKNVSLEVAYRTRQFWLLWAVLCLNVTAGIGILSMASPLLQEVFGGRLIGVSATFDQLTPDQKGQIAAIAAAFTGLLSLFNIAGRIFWASLSDRIGRKVTYSVFFLLGIALYASIPGTAAAGSLALFVAFFCVILSMYGGGFSTVPAYLADLFGTRMVGAIHGRLLTAWSVAGVLGPVIVNYIRDYQLDHGIPRAQVYSITMFILAALLAIGFICNWLVRPVDAKYAMTAEELAATAPRQPAAAPGALAHGSSGHAGGAVGGLVVAAWALVWIPIGWGVWVTLAKAVLLFK